MTAPAPVVRSRRSEDQLTVPMFVAGCLFVAAAVLLAAFTQTSDKVTITIGVIGALCLPTHRFVAAIRFWKKGENGAV